MQNTSCAHSDQNIIIVDYCKLETKQGTQRINVFTPVSKLARVACISWADGGSLVMTVCGHYVPPNSGVWPLRNNSSWWQKEKKAH